MTPVSPMDRVAHNSHRTPRHTTTTAPVTHTQYDCTHNISGKECTASRILPDAGSSTLVGQPENMSPVTPSGLTQKTKGWLGNLEMSMLYLL